MVLDDIAVAFISNALAIFTESRATQTLEVLHAQETKEDDDKEESEVEEEEGDVDEAQEDGSAECFDRLNFTPPVSPALSALKDGGLASLADALPGL